MRALRREHQARQIAAGIDPAGSLLVDLPDGTRVALDAGEVHLGLPGAGDAKT